MMQATQSSRPAAPAPQTWTIVVPLALTLLVVFLSPLLYDLAQALLAGR